MSHRSHYVLQEDTNSKCPHCDSYVFLLSHEWAGPKRDRAFYICWLCHRVYEVGRGEVRKEK